jgi:uncharacterized protein (DUF362 family)
MTFDRTRREFLYGLAAGPALTAPAPSSPVAVGTCRTYGTALFPVLERMFDQLGGLGKLVRNKTVAIKMNMTGSPNYRLGHDPAELTHYVHPAVIGAVVHLMGKAGARRVRVLEGVWSSAQPLEELMLQVGWEPNHILRAAPRVDMENINWAGEGKKYARFRVPNGGWVFGHYDFNHSCQDCDVFVSVAKMKEHATTGITLSLKNHFGSVPCTIYGDGAGIDEPSPWPVGGRTMLHDGKRQPAGIRENDPKSPRSGGWRVPRIIAEICAARPIDLAVIDGIESMTRGEGPWVSGCGRISPGLLVAGLNPVCTDAVATALMGFDPMAERATAPFERCDSHLRLAEDLGLGTRDLNRIDVVGTPIAQARRPFRRQLRTDRAPGASAGLRR